MIVLSSQRFISDDIVAVKKQRLLLESVEEIELPVVFIGEFHGKRLHALLDKHHTRAAAKELGIPTSYTEIERRETQLGDNYSLDDCLEALYMDSDWYDIETGRDFF